MSNSGEFKLIFEGPADESAETLRKLRASLLADVGLSVSEAQEALQNTPTTLKVSEVEEELKPIYAALKKAGGKVLLVCPEETTNEKAYFLDLEQTGLDEDLLKTLEDLPAEQEEQAKVDDGAVELDLTVSASEELFEELLTEEPEVKEISHSAEEDELANELLKSLTAGASEIVEEKAEEKEPAPQVTVDLSPSEDSAPLFDLSVEVKEEVKPEENLPALESTPSPLEVSAEVTEVKEEAQPETKEALGIPSVDLESKPLFEVEAPEAGESLNVPVPGTIAAPSEPLDLTLDFSDEPQPKKSDEAPKQESAKEEAPAPKVEAKKEVADFSLDELSSSLESQIESEVAGAKKSEKQPPSLTGLQVDAEEKKPTAEAVATGAPKEVSKAVFEETPLFAEEPNAEPVEELPVSLKKKSAKSSLGLDLIVPILVGAALLGVANWLYFSQDEEEIVLPQINFSNEDVKVSDDVLRAQANKAFSKLEAVSSEGDAALTWEFFHDAGVLKTGNVEVLRPPAPELRPEQIVRNERPGLWLRKIELSSFVFEKTADGGFKAKGPARIFLEQGPVKRRLVGQAELTVSSFTAPEGVTARLVVQRGLSEMPTEQGLSFEALPNGDIRLSVVTGVQK